jgi:1-deoxy-D-xylulose-5-phosphate reductoisomerase
MSSAPVRVAIAGSTGSIGTQTLEVVRAEGPERYQVVALGAGSSVQALVEQAKEFHPALVAVADGRARGEVAEALEPLGIEVTGDQADVVELADVVINGVVGFAGLSVTIETLRAGRRLGLANKESLIAAGPVVQPLRSTPGAELIPVDSEHCAVHQCLRSGNAGEVARIVITASGGPFRGRTADELANVTVAQALAHPTWAMGPKITVDSSTLMNKGLEVIEAHELFGIDYDRIEVVVHPQSVVHSMAEFSDGSTIAQLSMPDMRLPIGYALAYPRRIGTPFGRIDWATLRRLDFEPPDTATFRCLALAYAAGRAGGTAPAWLSGANEVAVDAFLAGLISWNLIADVSVAVLDAHDGTSPDTVDDVIAADAEARRRATDFIDTLTRT